MRQAQFAACAGLARTEQLDRVGRGNVHGENVALLVRAEDSVTETSEAVDDVHPGAILDRGE